MHSIFNPEPLGQLLGREYYRPTSPILANPCAISSDLTFASIFLLYSNCIYDHPIYNICGFSSGAAIMQIDMTPVVYTLRTGDPHETNPPARYAIPATPTFEICKNRIMVTGQWVHMDDMLTIDGNAWTRHVFNYQKYHYIGGDFEYKWEMRNNRTIECFHNAALEDTFDSLMNSKIYDMDFAFKTPQYWNALNIKLEGSMSQEDFPIMYGIFEIRHDAEIGNYTAISSDYERRDSITPISLKKLVLNRATLKDKTQYTSGGHLSHVLKDNLNLYSGYYSGKHFGWEPLNSPLGGLDSAYLRQSTNPCMNDRPIRTLEYGQDITGTLALYGNGNNVLTKQLTKSDDATNKYFINLGISTTSTWVDNLINKSLNLAYESIRDSKKVGDFIEKELTFETTFENYTLSSTLQVTGLFAWFFHKTGQQLLKLKSSKYSEDFNRHKLYQMLSVSNHYNWANSDSNFFIGERLTLLKNTYDLKVTIHPTAIPLEGSDSVNNDGVVNSIIISSIEIPFSQYYSSFGIWQCQYYLKDSKKDQKYTFIFDMFCVKIELIPKRIDVVFERDIEFSQNEGDKTYKGYNKPLETLSKKEKWACTPQICDCKGVLAFYSASYVFVYYYNYDVPFFEVYTIKKISDAGLNHQIISSWEKTFAALWLGKDTHLTFILSTREQNY